MEQIFREIAEKLKTLSVRIAKIETWEPIDIKTSTDNITVPPTAAELTTAFGSPVGWTIGIVDDNGADTNVYLCVSNGTSWFYVAMTKAV